MITCKACDHVLFLRCPECKDRLVIDPLAKLHEFKAKIIRAIEMSTPGTLTVNIDKVFEDLKGDK